MLVLAARRKAAPCVRPGGDWLEGDGEGGGEAGLWWRDCSEARLESLWDCSWVAWGAEHSHRPGLSGSLAPRSH